MRVLASAKAMADACKDIARPLGLVPTMGHLHMGHISLVQLARKQNESLAVSIFVNPTQFAAGEDFHSYPRNLDGDLELLDKEGTDLVFVPSLEEMYPPRSDTWVNVGGLAVGPENECRPGHFRGVTTVVTKLFNIARPDRAYFGQKDGEQAVIIRGMVKDLNVGVDIVISPTIRETNGLAMSSRNVHLSSSEKSAASVIYRALSGAANLWESGQRCGEIIQDEVRRILMEEPLVRKIDYICTVDANNLLALNDSTEEVMIVLAVWIGKTRLIDNVSLKRSN